MKQKKILLVYPRPPDVDDGKYAPLGVQYLASYLRSKNVSVKIADLTFMGWEGFSNMLKKCDAEFIGISAQTPIAEHALRAIKMSRELCPKTKIIIGGAHATIDVYKLSKNKNIDFIVIGEGEKAIYNIITGKVKSRIVNGERIEDLDSLPFPARDLMQYDEYLKYTSTMEIMVSRGCPFNCIFCQPVQRKLFGDKVKMRSADNVVAEIKQVTDDYGKGFAFWFVDDTFTWNNEWLEEFCAKVKPLGIKWRCGTRVNVIDEHKLRIMRDAGCFFISYGVESGSQRMLDFMRKGITVEQIKKAFELTHKVGIFCISFIIVGTPTETKKDLEMTINLVKEIHPDSVQLSIMTPMIGTDIEKYCIENNILNISTLDDYQFAVTKYPIKLENLTAEDLASYKKRMVEAWKSISYKNYPKYLKMLARSPYTFRVMFKSTLKRKIYRRLHSRELEERGLKI